MSYTTINIPLCTHSMPYALTRKELDRFTEIVKNKGMDKSKFIGFILKGVIADAERYKEQPDIPLLKIPKAL